MLDDLLRLPPLAQGGNAAQSGFPSHPPTAARAITNAAGKEENDQHDEQNGQHAKGVPNRLSSHSGPRSAAQRWGRNVYSVDRRSDRRSVRFQDS